MYPYRQKVDIGSLHSSSGWVTERKASRTLADTP
jgi:hypothetical protein